MEEKTPNLQLQEPVSPESLVPAADLTWLWIGLGVLAVGLLLALLIRKNKRPAALDPQARRRLAYQNAKHSLVDGAAPGARETAVWTSLILRRFLADAADDPSLFETHEEFVSRQDALKILSPSARDACAAGFSRLAKWKYAAEIPTDDPASIIEESRELLETLNGGFAG